MTLKAPGPMNTFLPHQLPVGAPPDQQQEWLLKMRFVAYELQALHRRYVPDANVIGGVVLTDTRPSKWNNWNLEEMRDAYDLSEEKFDGEVTDWHLHGGAAPHNCGSAWLGGSVRATYEGCWLDTMIHEDGHGMGFGHAKRRSVNNAGDVEIIEYGGTGAMAGKENRKMLLFNGPHSGYAGFVPVTDITESREILLCPLHLPKSGQHPQEIQCARVGIMHFFSYDGVTVHCSTLRPDDFSSLLYAKLSRAGAVGELMDGLQMQHLGSVNQSVKFAIIKGGQPPIPIERPATVLPEVSHE